MPQIIPLVAAGAANAAYTFLGGGVLGALGGAVVFGGVVNIGGKLFPASDQPAFAKDRLQTVRSSISPHQIIYGEHLVGGTLVFAHTTGDQNEFLHMVVVLAGHEVEAIDDVYFNDKLSSEYDGDFFRINKHLGKKSQTADSDLVSEIPNLWTSAHRLRGIAYVYVRLKYSQEVWPTGIPNIRARVRGKKLWDPRDTGKTITSSTYISGGQMSMKVVSHGFSEGDPIFIFNHESGGQIYGEYEVLGVPDSDNFTIEADIASITGGGSGGTAYAMSYKNNAALCRLDYLVQDFGLRARSDEVDTPSWIAAANICDEEVEISEQGVTFSPHLPRIDWIKIHVYVRASIVAPTGGEWDAAFPTANEAGDSGSWVSPDNANADDDADTRPNAAGADWIWKGFGIVHPFPWDLPGQGNEFLPVGNNLFYEVELEGYDPIGSGTKVEIELSTDGGAVWSSPKSVTLTNERKTFIVGSNFDLWGLNSFYDNFDLRVRLRDVSDAALDFLVKDFGPDIGTGTRVRLTTTGTLPSPFAAATDYYYINRGKNRFNLALSLSDAITNNAITITDSGEGAHTITRFGHARYDCNGVLDLDTKPIDAMSSLMTADGGVVVYTQGKYKGYSAGAGISEVTLDDDDLRGDMEVMDGPPRQELFNLVRGTYSDANNSFQPTDFAPVKNALYKMQDDNEERSRAIELPFTINSTRAQRLAKIVLERSRQGITVTMPCKLTALRVAPWSVIDLNIAQLGWSGKEFRVVEWKLATDGPGVDLVLQEEASGIYDWAGGAETSYDLAPNTNLPTVTSIARPRSITLSSGEGDLLVAGDGTIISRIRVNWTAVADAFLSHYEIETRNVTTGESFYRVGNVPVGTTEFFIAPVDDGQVYDVRVRAVNVRGVTSDWLNALNYTVIGKSEPPDDVENFVAAQNGAVAIFKWSQVSNVDLAGYEIRFGPKGETDFEKMRALTKVTRGTNVTSADLPPGNWTCAIKAVDTSGNFSTNAAYDDIDFENMLDIVFENEQAPDWLGTIITPDPWGFDSWPGTDWIDAVWSGHSIGFVRHPNGTLVPMSKSEPDELDWEVFDEAVPNPVDYCIYEYQASDVDLGFDDNARVWADIDAQPLFGNDSITMPIFELDFRKEDESYDGFEEWSIGVRNARHFRFRLYFDPSGGIGRINSFNPTVDQLERSEDHELTITTGGTTLAFDKAFHQKPFVTITPEGFQEEVPFFEALTTETVIIYGETGKTVHVKATGV